MMTAEEHRLFISDAIEGNVDKLTALLIPKFFNHFMQIMRSKSGMESPCTDAVDNFISLADVVREFMEHEQVDLNVKRRLSRSAFLQATRLNHVHVVRELLRHHTLNVNTRGGLDQTPLMLASDGGHWEVVRELLKHDQVDVNASYRFGTALTMAAESGHAKVVSDLLNDKRLKMNARDLARLTKLVLTKKKADPNHLKSRMVSELSQAKLFWASEHGYAEMVRESIKQEGLDLNLRGHRGRTPLIVASEWGQMKVVSELLNVQAVDVNAQDDDGRTSLIMASSVGHVKVVLALLKHPNVIVDAKDNTGRSALIWAGELGRMEVVRELLKHARVDVSLMPRICEDQVKVSRESLSSQKLDVNATKDQGPSAIILASGSGRLQRLLDVSRVGNLDGIVETGFGHTILMIASNRVSADIVGGLLNHWRVTVNVNNGYDFNAFVSARHRGHAQVVHEFSSSSLFMASALGRADVDDGLSKRVKLDVSAMTSRDRSAFTLANANDHLQIVGEVLRFMNANAVGNDGWTALNLASEEGHFAVALLKEKDVDASDKDDNGTTTSMLASGSGHSAVFRRSSEHECVDLIAVDDNGQIELMSAIDEDRLEGCS